jgi:hypothetical protein
VQIAAVGVIEVRAIDVFGDGGYAEDDPIETEHDNQQSPHGLSPFTWAARLGSAVDALRYDR